MQLITTSDRPTAISAEPIGNRIAHGLAVGALPPAAPLDPAAFAASMAALGPFEDHPFLAVAVSGGPDSLALTLLAAAWADALGGRAVGLTVDHGLRPGSAEEAIQTGRWLAAHGIDHHTLPWIGEKPATGLQRRAREARYALLTHWCRREGCLHLLTAHHRQDQAETVALRRAKTSGPAGLAAMPAIRDLRDLRLLRPLLGIDRARLRATLRAAGQPWIEDPSNRNPAFTRSRLRKAGLDVDALAHEAEHHGRARREADGQIAGLLVRHATIDPAGFARLDAGMFDEVPENLAVSVLTRLLMTVGGGVYPPRGRSLDRLFQALRAGSSAGARTLAHCRTVPCRGGWLICRERVPSDRLALVPGETRSWDGRFTVCLQMARRDLTLKALGERNPGVENHQIPKGKTRHLPGAVRRTLPALWQGHRLLAIPHLGLFDPTLPATALHLRFHPPLPLANAPFMPHMTLR